VVFDCELIVESIETTTVSVRLRIYSGFVALSNSSDMVVKHRPQELLVFQVVALETKFDRRTGGAYSAQEVVLRRADVRTSSGFFIL
jgi:hypothetical protein